MLNYYLYQCNENTIFPSVPWSIWKCYMLDFWVLWVWIIMSVLLLLAVLLAEKMNIHNGNMWKHRCLKIDPIPSMYGIFYLHLVAFFMVNVYRWIYTIPWMLWGCYSNCAPENPLETPLYNPYRNWCEWFVGFTEVNNLINNYVRISAPYCTTLII